MTAKAFLPLLLIAAAASLVPVLPAAAEPPAWAPAHGQRAKHDYVYYPLAEVYHDPSRNVWFWLDGDDWRSGSALPIVYRQYTHHGVNVQLDSERPFERHEHVVSQHGRGAQAVRERGREARDAQHGARGGKGQHREKGKHKSKAEKAEKDRAHGQGHDARDLEHGRGDRHPHTNSGEGQGQGQGPREGRGHSERQDEGRGPGPGLGDGSGARPAHPRSERGAP